MNAISAASVEHAKSAAKPDRPDQAADAAALLSDEELTTELARRIGAGAIGKEDIEDLLPKTDGALSVDEVLDDFDSLTTAREWWQRGDRREALVHLEYALGREFSGLGDLRPEDIR